MKTLPRQRLPATLVACLVLLNYSPAQAAASNQDLQDARQESQLSTTYTLNPSLRDQDIRVLVHEGKVTLTGTVEEGVKKELAKEIALAVAGVTSVDNQLQVNSDFVPSKSSATRSYGELTDDATISAAVRSKLLWSKYADGLAVTVHTKLGKVSLQGTASSPSASQAATRMASSTRGVVSVDNQLQISTVKPTLAESVKNSTQHAEQSISDSWITTKVKSSLLYSSHVESSSINVKTRHGVVALSGRLGSKAERALAIELSKNVRGVRQVDASALSLSGQ